MATESVAILHPELPKPIGTEADLFLTGDEVLTVYVSRHSLASPPDANSVKQLHNMVTGLARASIALSNEMVRDEHHVELWATAAEDVAFATMLLTKLADAATAELSDVGEKARGATEADS